MLAAAPWNWQLNDSYFVVAHFHYVLVGAIVFMIFAAIYYWFPKATGRLLNERLGKWHFWLFLIGFHMTFDTMHIPGILGMPRRIYTYEAGRGWETLNLICTIGVAVPNRGGADRSSGTLFVRCAKASGPGTIPGMPGPWNGAQARPPPEYNFAEIPTVKSRRPLWDIKHPTDPDWKYE